MACSNNPKEEDLKLIQLMYGGACQAQKCICYRNISTILGMAEESGILHLPELGLRPHHLDPIYTAIVYQRNLTQLDLHGNRMTDIGIEELIETLETLPNLALLNISRNHLTSLAISKLSSFLSRAQKEDKTKCLQSLTDLNISHNNLGDGCCMDLSTIISNLPSLTTLNLTSCDFTQELFEGNKENKVQLRQAFQNSSLTSLNISYNMIGCLGVSLLLWCLDNRKLLTLDLSSTLPANSATHVFIHHMKNLLSKEKSCLQTPVLQNAAI